MKPSTPTSTAPWSQRLVRAGDAVLQRSATYLLFSVFILLMDILTGRYLAFPILFVGPVGLAAWYGKPRLAYFLAVVLPIGRLPISAYVDALYPAQYSVTNSLVRIAVLALIAYLVNRTARQSKALKERVNSLVTICAWSQTVKYKGEWISFEQYLKRRFNIDTSHGISPAEAEKLFQQARRDDGDGDGDRQALDN